MAACVSQYLNCVLRADNLVQTVHEVAKALEAFAPFDAVAFTGISGASVGFPLAYETGHGVICVRKSHETSHSNMPAEGSPCDVNGSYVIVDDIICSGATIKAIIEGVERFHSAWVPSVFMAVKEAPPPTLKGVVLYQANTRGGTLGDTLGQGLIHPRYHNVPVVYT